MAWIIIIFASVVKKFSHFPNNFPSLFSTFMCNKPQHQPLAIFYYLCAVQSEDTKENNVSLWCDNNVMVFTLQPLAELFYFDYLELTSLYVCSLNSINNRTTPIL